MFPSGLYIHTNMKAMMENMKCDEMLFVIFVKEDAEQN